jgi:sugar phosphate isomerase/epimerase
MSPQNINRRTFLTTTGAGALAQAKSPQVRVGAHPWVYAKPRPNWDMEPILEDIFSDLAYAGLGGIELMWTQLKSASSVERIGELSGKHKLAVIGMSYNGTMWKREEHNAMLDELGALLPRLAKLGGRTMGTSVGTPNRKKTEAEFDAQAEGLRKAIRLCSQHGVVLNLHNHTYEVADGEFDLNGTLKRIPEARLGPDIGWLYHAKVDPVDFIHRRGRQMVFAHIRDEKADGTWAEAVGEGVMDYRAIGKALREARFSGDLVVELAHSTGFKPTRPIRESLKMSRENMRKVMGY